MLLGLVLDVFVFLMCGARLRVTVGAAYILKACLVLLLVLLYVVVPISLILSSLNSLNCSFWPLCE